jgi:hypothetical protein
MKQYKTTLYLNGDEVAFVNVLPSQKDRFEKLLERLGRYAARFGCNFQLSTQTVEE